MMTIDARLVVRTWQRGACRYLWELVDPMGLRLGLLKPAPRRRAARS